MQVKPHLVSIQGQTLCAVFGAAYEADYNLPKNYAGVLADAPWPREVGEARG